MKKLVRELMHPGLHICRTDTTLGQVASMLTQIHVHALVVVDQEQNPKGIITDYDLLAGEWLSAEPNGLATMRKLTAGELMTTPIETIDANADLHAAAMMLIEKEIQRLIVTENGIPLGVISTSDFVSCIAQAEKPKRELVADVMSDAILVCRNKTPLISAARTMTQAGWRSVLVVDEKGKPEGVVSGKDLLPFVDCEIDGKLTVRDIMHPPLTIDIHAPLQMAANLMIQKHHHRLVVIDQDDPEAFPLGIISSVDIVAEMAKPDSIWQK